MSLYEIPTGPSQRVMTIALAGTTYTLRLNYADAPDGGWFMDLSDAIGTPLVCGAPLVTGADILEQFPDLSVGGGIAVISDSVGTAPTFLGLGTLARLIFGDEADLAPILAAYADDFEILSGPTSGRIGQMQIGVGQIGVG